MEILNADKLVNRDLDSVLKRWENDFAGLFKPNMNNEFDDAFLREVNELKQEFEKECHTNNKCEC